MQKLLREYRHFLSYPRDMRILLLTNLIYALVGPVIDIFVAAYVMRNSRDVRLVDTYQLAVYAGIPFTFLNQCAVPARRLRSRHKPRGTARRNHTGLC